MSETETREGEAGMAAGQKESEETDKAPGRSGRGPAWLALLLALAAAGASAWLLWQHRATSMRSGQDTEVRVEALGQRLDAAVERQQARADELAARVAEAGQAADEARRELGALRGRLEALESARRDGDGELASLRRELASLDERVARTAEQREAAAGAPPELTLALTDAELLVRAAYRALAMDADTARAASVLEQADAQLAGLARSGVGRARRELAREIEALQAVPSVDRDGLAGRLAALAERVPALPLAGMPGRDAPAAPAGDAEAGGWWGATREFLGRYFTVRRTGQAGAELADPATLALVREVLRLELEQARAAVWSRDAGRYRSALDRAGTLMSRYFDTGSDAVVRFRERLGALADAEIAPELPETGAALDAVRDLRARLPGAG